ncbi:MAG: permease-like cell division protein FtsX [Bacteriovoracaceae bacterium]
MITSFLRITKTGFTNLIRNGWLSIASTTIMTLTLFTIAIFLILNIVLSQGIQTIQEKIDVSAYLRDSASQERIIALQEDLSKNPDVKNIRYVSKEDALARYREEFANNPTLKDSILEDENPLPASIEIKVYDPDRLEAIMPIFDKDEYKTIVSKVSYKENKEVIDKLFQATQLIKKVGWGLAIIFIITSLIVIFNTIRVAIFTHREEIEIMKLVGANPWFIKWPFIIEGMTYGIIATVLSFGVIYIVLHSVSTSLNTYFGASGTGDQVVGFLLENSGTLIALQLTSGILIGVASSYFAIRKHLKKA